MQHEVSPDYGISTSLMVTFWKIGGKVAGPYYSPYESSSRTSSYAAMGLIGEENFEH